MNANKQDAGGLPELPEPKYLARLSKDGEWAELIHSNDWTAEMWAHGTEDVYSGDQMRAYGEQCRAASAESDESLAKALESIAEFREALHGWHRSSLHKAASRLRALSRGVPEGK